MKAADLVGQAIALAGAVLFGAALLAGPGRAAEPARAPAIDAPGAAAQHLTLPGRAMPGQPVEQLDVWRLVFCPRMPPKRGECRLVDEVAPLPLGDCQDLARGAAKALPPPAVAGCLVDGDALATRRGW